MADGSLVWREKGTPQGGVISPLLADLFLHCAFDMGCAGISRTYRSSAMPTMRMLSGGGGWSGSKPRVLANLASAYAWTGHDQEAGEAIE
jgi:hypothetical protein